MSPAQTTSTSKFLSLVLRHEPSTAYVTLDTAGWVEVAALLAGCVKAGRGHSVEVELKYAPQIPPELLYHGTATRFLDSIRTKGLLKMERHHVHLSAEIKMTLEVGARHGKPVLLTILAGEMHREGHVFCRSTNGVWLVDHVPPQCLLFPELLVKDFG